MSWLGEYPEDFTAVTCLFTTHDQTGAALAPSSAFEADDVRIYKNGNDAQKATTNGVTMTSPFDTVTGLHALVIDTSNDTGDGGFWVAGAVYTLVLVPDETVDSLAVVKVIGQFGLALAPALRPTVAGRTLDVTATGAAGIDWANVENPTTVLALTQTTLAAVTLANAQGYKKNVAVSKFTFPIFDASGNGLTGQTVSTRQITKDGGAEAAITDTVTEIAGGWYEIDLAQAEMNADEIGLRFASPASKTTFVKIRTVSA